MNILIIIIIIIILIISFLYIFKLKLFKGGTGSLIHVSSTGGDNSNYGCIDDYHMMIISKYFNDLKDFETIETVNSKYKGITKKYKYNPIPITDKRTRKLFKNIETQHIYQNEPIIKKIKKYIIWNATYDEYLNSKYNQKFAKSCVEFKNVILTANDVLKYKDEIIKDNEAIIPKVVTIIGKSAFENYNSLTYIKFHENITKIGMYAFKGCSSLRLVEIPKNVSEIGFNAFKNCYRLQIFWIPEDLKHIEMIGLENMNIIAKYKESPNEL